MRLYSIFGIIAALSCLQNAMAQDTIWACRDDKWVDGDLYFKMSTSDTFPDNRGQFEMVDTGDALQGKYVNFDYQFGSPHPGYAGFKFYWDDGATQFWVEKYDSLIFWHKGPLPGHKVMMIWAQGSAGCGTPINYELMGEFKSSTVWKRESFAFPQKRNYGAAPDSQFVKNGLFELRMLIYNDSTVGTSPTSEPGNLKIDNMFFFQAPAHIPEIWEQPGSQTCMEGSLVILRILALGGTGDAGAMTYLWKKDGNPITEPTWTYIINSAQPSDAGTYTVTVTNSLGSVTSNPAVLTVQTGSAPVIQTQPQSQTVEEGGPVSFTVVATGTPAPTYQWKKDGNDIPGATSGIYTIASAILSDAGSYTVVVTNTVGSITSNAATLTVSAKEKSGCGCGSGTGLALIPPLFYKAMAYRKRKKKNPEA
jgi:hypothetical protein